MKNPCYNCENSGCGTYHDECPDYQEWRKELDRVKESRFKESQTEADLNYISHVHYMRMRKDGKTKW